MEKILREGRRCWESFSWLIAQPQSDVPHFRRFLASEGWTCTGERMVLEDGKYYPMMIAVPGGERKPLEEGPYRMEECFGPMLLEKRDPVLSSFLEREERICREILESLRQGEDERSLQRRREIEERLEMTARARREMLARREEE